MIVVECFNALSGLYIISTGGSGSPEGVLYGIRVNALSGLYLISTKSRQNWLERSVIVSMPSRAYTSFLPTISFYQLKNWIRCQCPLGLIPHFYFIMIEENYGDGICVNALSGLYIISTLQYIIY